MSSSRVAPLLLVLTLGLVTSLGAVEPTPDAERVRSHAEALLALGDRSPGSPGAEAAAQHLATALAAIGAEVDRFQVTTVVPIDLGSRLIVDGREIQVFPHQANGVATAGTGGEEIVAPLVFLGQGRPEDLIGRPVAGAIVVLEGDSGDAWKRCAMLGAKAALFTHPERLGRRHVDDQSVEVSLPFPRLVVDALDPALDGSQANLRSQVRFESRSATTVLGRFRGRQQPADEAPARTTLILASGYESPGVIRGRAPGATRAWNAALTLEAARQLAASPRKEDLLVVFHGARQEWFRGLRLFLAAQRDRLARPAKVDVVSDEELDLELPILDLQIRRTELELWRASEVRHDLEQYVLGGEDAAADDVALVASFEDFASEPELTSSTTTDGIAEIDAPNLLDLDQIAFLVIISGLLAYWFWHRERLGIAPRQMVALALVWLAAVGWTIANRPTGGAFGSGNLGQERVRVRELGVRFLTDEAGRRADALNETYRELNRKLSHNDDQALREQLRDVDERRRRWRNIQQKFGKRALDGELEAPYVRDVVLALTESRGGQPSNLVRHEEILSARLAELHSLRDVLDHLGPVHFAHLVVLDLSDGGSHWSTRIKGAFHNDESRLGWIHSQARRLCENLIEEGVALAYDPSPHLISESSDPWWPAFYQHEVGNLQSLVNGVSLSTVNDQRLKLGSPADTAEAFASDRFLAQTRGLTAFLDAYLASGIAERRLSTTKAQFATPKIRVETSSEGSATGLKGFPYPFIETRYQPSETDEWATYRFGIRFVETHLGDGFGEVSVPWVYDNIAGHCRSGGQVRVFGFDQEGRMTHALATGGTQRHSSGKEIALGLSKKDRMKDIKAVVFEAQRSWLIGTMDPRLLLDLGKGTVLSAARDAAPNYSHIEIDKDVAVAYAPIDVELRLLLSQGDIENRLLLLGTPKSDDLRRFTGLQPGGLLSNLTAFDVAQDTFQLNEGRLARLRENGVNPESLLYFHSQAEGHLQRAEEARANGDLRTAIGSGQAAWAMAGRVYPAVRSTANDVVHGLVVMLIFAIPFALICERLFVAGSTIYEKVGGFSGFFVATFLFFFFFHPAFALATTPIIIFLAFTIIVMSTLVIVIVYNRFEHEMEVLRMASLGMHKVDVSRLGTLIATVNLGISNMRRRPLRTALTAITVVLMTFILLTFASFNAAASTTRLSQGINPGYQGILLRQAGWLELPNATTERIASLWGENFAVYERRWLSASNNNTVIPLNGPAGPAEIEGVVGITNGDPSGAEAALIRPDQTEPGFGGDTDWLFLPTGVQGYLGVAPGDDILFQGLELKVGTLDTDVLADITHLDGEAFTPLAPVELDESAGMQNEAKLKMLAEAAEGNAEVDSTSSIHLGPTSVAFTHRDVLARIDSTLNSLALVPRSSEVDLEREAEGLAQQHALTLRVGSGQDVYLLTAVGSLSVAGLSDVLIPLILGGMIIFSTMLGSVAERGKEIFIYASLGLAPLHIGTLFLVEAGIYAVLGGLGGYMVAQAIVACLGFAADLGLATQPDLNYSSFTAVITILLVMATVLVSALYPAWIASKAANPGADTSFAIPDPEGDVIDIPFPFTVGSRDVRGLFAYLDTYLEAHNEATTGCFTASETNMEEADGILAVSAKTWLAPFDLGISQDFRIEARPTDAKAIYAIHIRLRQLSGQRAPWKRINTPFLSELRQQFLVWRTLDDATMDRYRALGGDPGAQERVAARAAEARQQAEAEAEAEKQRKEELKKALQAKNAAANEAAGASA